MKSYIICIQTLCGRISPVGFGSKKDRRHLERWRDHTDATLLGAGSLRNGDPQFKNSLGEIPKGRIRAFITMSGNIPTDKSIFRMGPKPFIFCSHEKLDDLAKKISGKARLFPIDLLGPGELDLAQITNILKDQGIKRLLIEGGGTLNFYALKQKIVDELVITLAPKLITSDMGTRIVHGNVDLGYPFLDLQLVTCKTHLETGEIFIRYRIKKEKALG